MQIGIPAETVAGESRVAATPETAKKLIAVTDEAYKTAGCEIADQDGALGCELVLKVRSPQDDELKKMKAGGTLVGMLNPFDADGLKKLADAKLTAFCARSRTAHHARAEHGRAV